MEWPEGRSWTWGAPGEIREQMLTWRRFGVATGNMFQGHVGVSGTQG